MAAFCIRLMLSNAPHACYSELHDRMIAAGYTRTIRGDNGITYHLPWGEYRLEASGLSPSDVRENVKINASSVWPYLHILVTEEISSAWVGLEPAAPSLASLGYRLAG